jgi:hypothetical protein
MTAAAGRVVALRALTAILTVALITSVVHYSDNYLNYSDFPRSQDIPNPSAAAVLGAWFAFTAAGLAGYELYRRRGPSDAALLLLAAYSGSGLIGIGHYAVPGALGMPWWRQAHVILDIGCGAAMLGFALWAVRHRR